MREARVTETTPGRTHWILQFPAFPSEDTRLSLESRGFSVLAYVPDNAFLVSTAAPAILAGLFDGIDLVYAGALTLENKFSPLIDRNAADTVWTSVAELHSDVEGETGRQIAVAGGLEILDNPDLPAHALLLQGTVEALERFAEHDEVASLYPAARELVEALPLTACLGGAIALAEDGTSTVAASASLASSFGDGWDGAGLGSANLTYYLGRTTPALSSSAVRSEVQRALAAWSAAVRVTFNSSSAAQQRRQIDLLFADRVHGDGQSFDGRGGVLAHTFYPPPNAESLAGDLHFDIEEPWRISNDIDVFSVTLHELGHALGLGHSDNPSAVMYPYYRRFTGLNAVDIAEIRKLYASTQAAAPPPNPPPPPPGGSDRVPPALSITTPSLTTTATSSASYTLLGKATDNTGVASVSWSNSAGGSGDATGLPVFSTGPIPLRTGQNRITLTARDTAGNTSWRTVTITRR